VSNKKTSSKEQPVTVFEIAVKFEAPVRNNAKASTGSEKARRFLL
jgi:hypothetical protein